MEIPVKISIMRRIHNPWWTAGIRAAGFLILCFALLLLPKDARLHLRAQNAPTSPPAAQEASGIGMLLNRDYPDALDDATKAAIAAAMKDSGQAGNIIWRTNTMRTTMTADEVRNELKQVDALYLSSFQKMETALALIPGLIELSGHTPVSIARTVSLPFSSAVLVVRRQSATQAAPTFFWNKVDLSSGKSIDLDLGNISRFTGVLELLNPPPGSSQFQVHLIAEGTRIANLDLSVTVPPHFPFRVDIQDGAGHPTEAAVGVYSPQERFLVPPSALDFSAGGAVDLYQPVNYRNHDKTLFWPGKGASTRCFFVKGGFTLELPAGSYRLIATKGPEFVPMDREIRVGPDQRNSEKVDLHRWIDMSELGWHSGDTHVHYARIDPEANQRISLWSQAEDLQVANIVRMGDGRRTYFEQYAFGKAGRFLYRNGALVPGQEDPRTSVLGHMLSLNLKAPIHNEPAYYLYSNVFDEAHRQGGLSGYAHVNSDSFQVHRDMTINIPRHKVDFAEICEFGTVGTDLYYEFLNLGFQLTATGGSDVPWGNTIGNSRVYVYTGGKLDPDQWFDGLQKGHTFVTAAPILEFTVDNRLPGDALNPAKGKMLKVHARALVASPNVPLGRLEIVTNGEVIRAADPASTSAALDFEIPADHSMWIAARAAAAHTTPVYITVDGKRHWKLSEVPALLEKRLHTLDEVEKLIDSRGATVPLGHEIEWENPEAFREDCDALRQMVYEARAVYLKLQEEARAQVGR